MSEKQKSYRSTGSNKLVFDFRSDPWSTRWGLEAQIKCMVAEEINECDAGTHDCEENAECVPTTKSSYVCKCPTANWGTDKVIAKGEGTKSDPCFWDIPNHSYKMMQPIKLRISFNVFHEEGAKRRLCNEQISNGEIRKKQDMMAIL